MAFECGITFIIPAYNVSNYIVECVESIVNSKFPRIEIIIVDDGSLDDTAKVVTEILKSQYSDNDVFIKLISQSNQGVSVARNRGINEASYSWVSFVDADDLIKPGLYEEIKNIEENYEVYLFSYVQSKNRDCSILNAKHKFFSVSFSKKDMDELLYRTLEFTDKEKLYGMNLRTSWAAIYERNFLIENNIMFPSEVKNGEDMLFRLRVFECCKSCYYQNTPSYLYYNNPSSLTNRYKPDIHEITNKFFINLEPIVQTHSRLKTQYLKSVANNFFLEMDHFLFHKENNLTLKEKYRYFYNCVESELYKGAFSEANDFLKQKFKSIVYKLLQAKLYDMAFCAFMIKYFIKKLIRA